MEDLIGIQISGVNLTLWKKICAAIRLTVAEVHLLSTEYNHWRSCSQELQCTMNSRLRECLSFWLTWPEEASTTKSLWLQALQNQRSFSICTMCLSSLPVQAQFFASTAHRFIALPEPDEFPALMSHLRAANQQINQHRVILYVDEFIVKIQRPDHAGDAYFCGRHGKNCDSINVQYVTDCFGRIRHVVTGLSGATHDKTAISWSANFMAFLNALPADYAVLGDPAYRGLHPRVITTFTGANLTAAQLQFNNECTRLRQVR